MKLVLAQTEILKDNMNVINELIVEGKFEVTTEGILMKEMDPSNVSMVVFKIEPSAFVEYDVTEKETFAVNINQLNDILKKTKKDEIICLELADNKLNITLKSDISKHYKIPILDVTDMREQKIPELDFKTELVLDSNKFKNVMISHEEISTSVKFTSKEGKFITESNSDLKELTIPIETEYLKNTESFCKYSTEYIIKYVNSAKVSSQVIISFGTDYPLKLEYKQNDKYSLVFYTAPRIDN